MDVGFYDNKFEVDIWSFESVFYINNTFDDDFTDTINFYIFRYVWNDSLCHMQANEASP